jgi:hypothetical protein
MRAYPVDSNEQWCSPIFDIFRQKIWPVFHKNDSDSHEIPRKTQNILQIRPENHENREGAVFEAAGFRDFLVEFAKYFVFFGVFHGNRSHFYEKWTRFWRKMSKIDEYHCSLLSTYALQYNQ